MGTGLTIWGILSIVMITGLGITHLASRRACRARAQSACPADNAQEHEDDRLALAARDRMALMQAENLYLRAEIASLRDRLAVAEAEAGAAGLGHDVAFMILGLDPAEEPSEAAVKAAFTRSVQRHHPDLGGNPHSLRLVMMAREQIMTTRRAGSGRPDT